MLRTFVARAAFLSSLAFCGAFHLPGQVLWLSSTNDSGAVQLSWPAWARDGVLEQSTNPWPLASWTSISPALYRTNAGGFLYRLPTLEPSRFFRVRRVGPSVPGLVGNWGLDEGSGTLATDNANSGVYLHLTNTTWAQGRFGRSSVRFGGQAASARLSYGWLSNSNYQVLPAAGQPFSLSFWFNPDALDTGSQRLLGNDANGGDGWHLALDNPGPGTNFIMLAGSGAGTSLTVTGRALLLPGQWHQLTVAYATNQATLYLDGRFVAQGYGSLMNHEGPVYLGSASSSFPAFSGLLDELRVYTNVLSYEQISTAGEWHFDENTGSLAADSSTRGQVAGVVSPTAWAPGKSGSGVDVSARPVVIPNEDYAVLPPTGAGFSVSLWVCPRGLPLGRSGLLSCTDGFARGWQLTADVEAGARTWLEFTSTNLGGTLDLRTSVVFTNGQWTRLDLTYNGGIAAVYVNGCKVRSESGAIRAAAGSILVGAAPGAINFNGVVDELKVYGRERQAEEIGPVALPLWEMALLNSSTNLVLPAFGPPGKPLSYTILSAPVPTRGTITSSLTSAVVTYRAGSQKGPDFFAYAVSDGEFTSPPATGVVSVVEPHWLSPGGGPLQPRDGSGPRRAWAAGSAAALDAIWKTNNYYDCFFYAPGEFQTTGWRFMQRSTANPGCKHIGSGSQGPYATAIRLVNTWSAWEEGVIFSTLHQNAYCDGFEVRNLILDCNGDNNPKYVVGEPVWLRIPLTMTSRVETVTLHWGDASIAGNSGYRLGRPAEFAVSTRTFDTNGYRTNWSSFTTTNQVDHVTVGSETDEILIQLSRRADGVDFYGLSEMEVFGAKVSLPTATIPGGDKSQLDARHSILEALDGDPGTAWASGSESMAMITLPLAARTPVSRLDLRWNCQTLPDSRRLGPAASYIIYTRDEATGELRAIPFVSHGRQADGLELATFGSAQSTNTITTDQVAILLVVREAGVDSYSIRELNLWNGVAPVPLRVPTAMNTLSWDRNRSILRAFDGDLATEWASGTQGSVTAIEALGSNLKFTGLKIVGFGTKAVRECFSVSVFASAPSARHPEPMRNVLAEDCFFTQPATNNRDGVSVLAVVGQGTGSLFNGIIRRCAVTGVSSYFTYSHAFAANQLENCFVDDCETGVYYEPDPKGWTDTVGPVLIRSNLFRNVRFAVAVDFHPGGRFDSLVCQDNEIVLGNVGGQGYAIRFCDICLTGPSGSITNVTLLNNVIRYPDWAPRPADLDGGLVYSDIHHAVYGNNLIALGTPNTFRVRPYPAGLVPDVPQKEDCDHPGFVSPGPPAFPPSVDALLPGYRRAWFNNRDLSGALLPVRHAESGIDRLASQQQWPE